MVFCTQCVEVWWSWEPLRRPCVHWVQKTLCCNLASSAPDDGHMRPKHVELKKHQ